ncbi:hypothetical protein B7463_g3149, partial [Scytalidium lignicola]
MAQRDLLHGAKGLGDFRRRCRPSSRGLEAVRKPLGAVSLDIAEGAPLPTKTATGSCPWKEGSRNGLKARETRRETAPHHVVASEEGRVYQIQIWVEGVPGATDLRHRTLPRRLLLFTSARSGSGKLRSEAGLCSALFCSARTKAEIIRKRPRNDATLAGVKTRIVEARWKAAP